MGGRPLRAGAAGRLRRRRRRGRGGDSGTGEGARAAQTRQKLNGADTPRRADFPRPREGQTLQDFANGVGATGTQIGLATRDFMPGRNRLAFGVLSSENSFVYGPTAVYVARSPESTDVRGPYVAPADLLVTEPAFRSQQAATEQDPFAAVYEAERRPVLVGGPVGRAGGHARRRQARGSADQGQRSPRRPDPAGGGARAGRGDRHGGRGRRAEAVDTRRPTSDMHDVSFDDVVGKKPVALLFATPQLCQSRVCGPVVDIALQLREKYGDRMEFIHQEVYVDNDANKGLREPLRRFNLRRSRGCSPSPRTADRRAAGGVLRAAARSSGPSARRNGAPRERRRV